MYLALTPSPEQPVYVPWSLPLCSFSVAWLPAWPSLSPFYFFVVSVSLWLSPLPPSHLHQCPLHMQTVQLIIQPNLCDLGLKQHAPHVAQMLKWSQVVSIARQHQYQEYYNPTAYLSVVFVIHTKNTNHPSGISADKDLDIPFGEESHDFLPICLSISFIIRSDNHRILK